MVRVRALLLAVPTRVFLGTWEFGSEATIVWFPKTFVANCRALGLEDEYKNSVTPSTFYTKL